MIKFIVVYSIAIGLIVLIGNTFFPLGEKRELRQAAENRVIELVTARSNYLFTVCTDHKVMPLNSASQYLVINTNDSSRSIITVEGDTKYIYIRKIDRLK